MGNKKWDIGWGPISKCNMKCQFCYSKEKRADKNSDLHLSDWLRFIDNNHSAIRSINYGTGENSLSIDWFLLVEHIRKCFPDIKQAVTSNGYISVALQNPHCKKIFIDAIDEVDISLDFCDPELHGSLRGQKDAFSWAINAMDICRKTHKKLTLVFLGSSVNTSLPNIDGLFEIARKYDAILRMNIFRPMDINDPALTKFILPYQNVVKLLQYIDTMYQILSLSDPFFSALFSGPAKIDHSGSSSLRILANGNVTPSTYLIDEKYILGNITDPEILLRISQSPILQTMMKNPLPLRCRKCILAAKCKGGVIDRRYLWHNSLEKPDPYCPGCFESSDQLPEPLHFSQKSFDSVHDDYLPTMFFSSKKDKEF